MSFVVDNILWERVGIPRQFSMITSQYRSHKIENIEIQVQEANVIGYGLISLDYPLFKNQAGVEAELQAFFEKFSTITEFSSVQDFIETIKIRNKISKNVLAGLDMAVHDLLAKKENLTLQQYLYKLYKPEKFSTSLAGKLGNWLKQSPYKNYRNVDFNLKKSFYTIPICGLFDIQKIVPQAKKLGFNKFRIKAGRDVQKDILRLKKVVQEAGQSQVVAVEANGGYSLADSLKMVEAMKILEVPILIQPTDPKQLSDLKTIKEFSSVRIYAKEVASNYTDIQRLIENKIVDGIVFGFSRIGGLYHIHKIISEIKNLDLGSIILEAENKGSMSTSLITQYGQIFPEISYINIDSPMQTKYDPYKIIPDKFFDKRDHRL